MPLQAAATNPAPRRSMLPRSFHGPGEVLRLTGRSFRRRFPGPCVCVRARRQTRRRREHAPLSSLFGSGSTQCLQRCRSINRFEARPEIRRNAYCFRAALPPIPARSALSIVSYVPFDSGFRARPVFERSQCMAPSDLSSYPCHQPSQLRHCSFHTYDRASLRPQQRFPLLQSNY
jgi:hypothetical protein